MFSGRTGKDFQFTCLIRNELVSRIDHDPYKAANSKRHILFPTGKLAKDLN